MKKSAKLSLRMSEVRSEINGLPAGEESVTKRRELLGQLDGLESEYRTALTAEAETEQQAPDANGLSAEERELRALESRAELRSAFHAIMNDRVFTGAEAELQQAFGLSGHSVPLAMVAPVAEEQRADAISAAPANVQANQHPIIRRVFARSATAALGVSMPMVGIGEALYHVISAGAEAKPLAKDGDHGDATAATLSPFVLSPTRIQSKYVFRLEDAKLVSGLEDALRRDLSDALSDKVDQQTLAGDGSTGAQFKGFLATNSNGGLADVADPTVVTYPLSATALAEGIDGKFAGSQSECAVVLGPATAHKLAATYQTNESMSALLSYQKLARSVMASANIPAQDGTSKVQQGVLARMGGGAMNAVFPVWDGIMFVRDTVTQVDEGRIVLTAIMQCNFRILRPDGFLRLKYKLSA